MTKFFSFEIQYSLFCGSLFALFRHFLWVTIRAVPSNEPTLAERIEAFVIYGTSI